MSRVHSLGQFIPSLGISSRSLERVNLTKLLGIHFSEHLSWEHCTSTNCQKSCLSALGILRKIKKLYKKYLPRNNPRETQVKPCPVRNWMGNEYRLEGPYSFFLCFLFSYCPNWNALLRNINKLVWQVRRTDNCSFISIFDRSYLEAITPIFFYVFC